MTPRPNIKSVLGRLLARGYFFIFHEPPGETSRHTISNFLFNFGGIAAGTSITFLFNVWAIRMLGPTGFGKANIILSVSQFLLTFLLFGLTNSAARYLAREKQNRGTILGSILLNALLLSLLFMPAFWLMRSTIAKTLRVDAAIINWSLVYVLIMTATYLSTAILRGLDEFKKLAWFTAASAFVFSGWVAFSILALRHMTYGEYTVANGLRWITQTIATAVVVYPLIRRPSWRWIKETFHFGVYHVGIYLAGFFFLGTIDNLMLNYYKGAAVVGIYGAYYLTFAIFTSKLLQPLIDTIYPTASTIDNSQILLARVLQSARKLLPIIFIGALFLTAFLFLFYGRGYPFSWLLAGLMAMNVSIYTPINLMASIIGSRGIRGARFLVFGILTAAIINVALNALLIPRWGLTGVMLATTASSLVLLRLYWNWLRSKAAEPA